MDYTLAPLLISLGWSLLIALFAVPPIIRIAHQKQLFDKPNLRTVHATPTPRLGGLAIFAGFVSALVVFGDMDNGVQQLLAGCLVLFFVGLEDDLMGVSALRKFAIQLLATSIVVFMADIRITSFQGVLGVGELPIELSYAFTFLVMIGVTNIINLIDGVDGLAGSIVIIIVTTFGIAFLLYGGAAYANYAVAAFCLSGSLLGFLRYNFLKATIFMGDTGSLLCGFIVAVLAIRFIEMRAFPAAPPVALGILFVPLFDTVRVFIIRIMNGRSPFAPDMNHIHHRLLAMGFSQFTTVLLLAAMNVLIIIFVLSFKEWGSPGLLWGLLLFSIVLSTFLGVYRPSTSHRVSKV